MVRAALEANPPPLYQNRRPKIYYATQVGVEPPTIVLFCNDPKAFGEPYRRYLLGVLRDHLPFAEVPIKLYLRKRQSGDRRADIETGRTGPKRRSSMSRPDRFEPGGRFGRRLGGWAIAGTRGPNWRANLARFREPGSGRPLVLLQMVSAALAEDGPCGYPARGLSSLV